MAVLASEVGGSLVVPHQLTVGRSPGNHLRLDFPEISSQHATLRWTESGWKIRDLNSRNGVYVDGLRLPPDHQQVVAAGARITFGAGQVPWILIDDTAPEPMARALREGQFVTGDAGLLPLPTAERPSATIYRAMDGAWLMESSLGQSRVEDGQLIQVDGLSFALHLFEGAAETRDSSESALSLSSSTLHFRVSRDREHVALSLVGKRVIDLGARSHHYPLLLLAQAQLTDRADPALGPAEQGWMAIDQLAEQLRTDATYINVGVFRCRKQLAAAGVLGAEQIIERRRGTGQLRLGVMSFEIIEQ
jgi:FHA domain